jgi:TonB family protein
MISEIIHNRKQRLILLCVLLSILVHVGFVALNFFHQFNNAQPFNSPPQKKPKPMMMMQQPPQPMHRVHRAGTGKNAPKTDKALGMGQQQVPIQAPPMKQRTPPPPTQELQKPQPIEQKQTPKKPPLKKKDVKMQKRTFTSPSGKLPMQKFFQDAIDEEDQRQQDAAQQSLDFLSPQSIYQAMRQRAAEASAPGVAEQYGDLKYLHYNQKVYQALQQSMSINVNRLSQQQHKMLIEGVDHPTRIRFALDQNGKIKGMSVTLSSGNPSYDSIAHQIVKDASYPPIPKSFDMQTTYHTYGIVLYYTGAPQPNFGVSPYLEGE